MDFEKIDPHIRFLNIFSYFPKEDFYVVGYDYRLFYITDGKIFLNFKDSDHTLEKDSLAMIPSGIPYKLSAYNGTSCEIMCFNFDTVKGKLTYESVHPDPESVFDNSLMFESDRAIELGSPIVIPDASALHDRLFEIYREFKTKQFGYRKKGESLLASVLVSCVRNAGKMPKKEVRLALSVKEYLIENLSEECSAELLGEIFHYHPNYINRVFKENFGVTMHSFLIQRRIKNAKQLLASSNLSLEKIALKCGFKTLAHFSLSFKNNCGVSPSEYRKMSETIII